MLANMLRNALKDIQNVIIHDIGKIKCGIITFSIEGYTAEEIKRKLSALNINVSVSVISSTRIDMEQRGLVSVIRASVHYYNTEEEVDRFCETLTRVALL